MNTIFRILNGFAAIGFAGAAISSLSSLKTAQKPWVAIVYGLGAAWLSLECAAYTLHIVGPLARIIAR